MHFSSKNSIGIGTIQDNDGTSGIAQIAAGNTSTCKLDANGVVKCWGMRTLGKLGIASYHQGDEPGEMGDNLVKINLPSGVTYTEIQNSRHVACAIRSDGAINCWGNNNSNLALGLITPAQPVIYPES